MKPKCYKKMGEMKALIEICKKCEYGFDCIIRTFLIKPNQSEFALKDCTKGEAEV